MVVETLGGWSVDQEVVDCIKKLIPAGSTVLELGSGLGTSELSKCYNMISIENNLEYIGLHKSTYIYAPLKETKPHKKFPECNTWYDASAIEVGLNNKHYDLLLIDGPSGPNKTRATVYKYRHLFNWNIPVIFDDADSSGPFNLAITLCKTLPRQQLLMLNADKRKSFIVMANSESLRKLL